MFECRIKAAVYPEEGDVVMVRISAINDDIITAKLLEYGDIEGLIMSGELSKKKYRSITQVTKVGNAELCQVIKVDKAKGHIDLSLKRVGDKERLEGKDEFSKTKISYQVMQKVAKAADKSIASLYETFGYDKEAKYGSLFNFFVKAKDNLDLLGEDELSAIFKKTIEEQFKVAAFKVRVDVDVSTAFGGIQLIKDSFKKATDFDDSLEITLVRPPTYSILKICESKEEGFNAVNTACSLVKEHIERNGGTFSISSPASVYGDKSKLSMFEETHEEEVSDDEDDDFSDE